MLTRYCIVVAGITLLLLACKPDSALFTDMESSERAANERARNELVAYISLETMFPDEQVRALAKAAGIGQLNNIDALLDKGVNVNARGTADATPMFWAMRNLNGFERLLERGADPNVIFNDGSSVIMWAIQNNNREFLRLALKYGGDSNLTSERLLNSLKPTPLFTATGPVGKDKAGMLLDAGAYINYHRSFNGDTPVNVAAGLGQYDLVYELLNRGADYTIENNYGDDLMDTINIRKKTMDPNNELTRWMEKVIAWLEDRGIHQ